jgi:hypothetical protein
MFESKITIPIIKIYLNIKLDVSILKFDVGIHFKFIKIRKMNLQLEILF